MCWKRVWNPFPPNYCSQSEPKSFPFTPLFCAASAGLGPNLLLARLATEWAKPNGQFMVRQEQARQFLAVSALQPAFLLSAMS